MNCIKNKQLGRRWAFASLVVGIISLNACDSGKTKLQVSEPMRAPHPTGAPVQTPPPHVPSEVPAFPEQTRAPEVKSKVTPKMAIVASKLQQPWGIDFLPDGRMLISEHGGKMVIVTPSGELSPRIDIPNVRTKGQQGGLLDVKLARDFAKSRIVYWTFAEERGDDKNGTTLARGKLSKDEKSFENIEVIFRQMPAIHSEWHFGSRLVWDRNGDLFMTLGERATVEARGFAQDLNTHLGKIVRIHADGTPLKDNPFYKGGGLKEIWSYGHRNPQGVAIHPQTGEVWTIEHGPHGGDEVNQPKPGKNYGWPIITYGNDYNGKPIGEGITAKEGMEQPIYYWDPVIAPSGLFFYSGKMFAEWQGNLLIGSMNPGALVRLVLDGKTVIGEERMFSEAGRVRGVAEGPDGAVWMISDHGKLLKVSL